MMMKMMMIFTMQSHNFFFCDLDAASLVETQLVFVLSPCGPIFLFFFSPVVVLLSSNYFV